MSDAFATHEVFNQSPPFEDVNLFTSDPALAEAVSREGGGHAAKRLAAFGAVCGSAEAFQRGRLANDNPPRLRPFDSKGRRLDVVEFHPAYHECMEISVKEGLHCSAWDHLAKPGTPPVPGANVGIAGLGGLAATTTEFLLLHARRLPLEQIIPFRYNGTEQFVPFERKGRSHSS